MDRHMSSLWDMIFTDHAKQTDPPSGAYKNQYWLILFVYETRSHTSVLDRPVPIVRFDSPRIFGERPWSLVDFQGTILLWFCSCFLVVVVFTWFQDRSLTPMTSRHPIKVFILRSTAKVKIMWSQTARQRKQLNKPNENNTNVERKKKYKQSSYKS